MRVRNLALALSVVFGLSCLAIGQTSKNVTAEILENKTITCYTIVTGWQRCAATGSITDAQIKNLPTSAHTLVAAAGSGTLLAPVRVLLFSKFTGGAYTNVTDGGYIYVGPGGIEGYSAYIQDDAGNGIARLTELLGATAKMTYVPPYFLADLANWGATADPVAHASASNQPLVIAASNSGNYTGGNGSNTLTYFVEYDKVTLP